MNDYVSPKNAEELGKAIATMPDDGLILGGGTDFVIYLREHNLHPSKVLYTGNVDCMRKIIMTDKELIIGGAVTMREMANYPHLGDEFAALVDACSNVGSPQIRNKATLGGNMASSSPAGDTIPVLSALNANIEVMGGNGKIEIIPVDSFITGKQKNVLKNCQVVYRIHIPRTKEFGRKSAFVKLGSRSHVTIAKLGVAASIARDNEGKIMSARLSIGAISVSPVVLYDAEKMMIGKCLSNDLAYKVSLVLADALPNRPSRLYKAPAARGVIEDLFNKFN